MDNYNQNPTKDSDSRDKICDKNVLIVVNTTKQILEYKCIKNNLKWKIM